MCYDCLSDSHPNNNLVSVHVCQNMTTLKDLLFSVVLLGQMIGITWPLSTILTFWTISLFFLIQPQLEVPLLLENFHSL